MNQAVNKLHHCSSLNLDELLPNAESLVDVTITSPPYWDQKDYGSSKQIGFGQTKEDFLNDLNKILEHCLAVTKSTGSLWLIIDDFWIENILQLLPWEVAQCAQSAGWHLRDMIVWDKGHNLPYHTKGQMRHVSEFIFFMTKTRTSQFKYYTDRVKTLDGLSKWWVDFPERFNPKGKTPTNIWQVPLRTQGTWRKPSGIEHHCPFPTELVSRIIELTTDPGDLVMDPFAGSGVVLAVAEAMKRRFIGCEVNDEYIKMYQETVRQEVAAEWVEMQDWKSRHIEAKLDFENTILKLRALKFARQVTRPLVRELNADDLSLIHSIVCTADLPESYSRGTRFDVEVRIVVNEIREVHSEALIKVINRSKRPPLTQYGIDSVIKMDERSRFAGSLNGTASELYYLYPQYQTREYTDQLPLDEWISMESMEDHQQDKKIPLLSNVDVNVEWVLKK